MTIHFTDTIDRTAESLTPFEKGFLLHIANTLAEKLVARGYKVGHAIASANYVRVDSSEIAPDSYGDSAAIEYKHIGRI
jgi:uncharacterized lipoprotein YajG